MAKQQERAEATVRFQTAYQALHHGHYEVLTDQVLVEDFVRQLLALQKIGDKSELQSVIEMIAACCCHGDERVRCHGLEILCRYIRSSQNNKTPSVVLVILAQAFSSWLKCERGLLANSLKSIETIVLLSNKLVELRLWGDVEILLKTALRVGTGIIPSHPEAREALLFHFSPSTGKVVMSSLVSAFAKATTVDRQRVKNILQIFGDEAAPRLIDELFKHPDKEVRIALFEVITRKAYVIVPAVLKRLAVKQPWYVLRNAILLLALLDDSGFFRLVKPFLKHPDYRVQKAVIDFIALVGSDEIRSDLVDAILVVDDRLLPGLILLLQQHGGEEIEAAFLSLLSDRHQIAVEVRDEVVVRLCESGLLPPTRKTLEILDRIVSEEGYGGSQESSVAKAAERAMRVIETGCSPK